MIRRFSLKHSVWSFTLLLVLARVGQTADDMAWPDEDAPPPRATRTRPTPKARRPAERAAPLPKAKRPAPPAPKAAPKPAAKPVTTPAAAAKSDRAKKAAEGKSDPNKINVGADDDDGEDEDVENVEAAPSEAPANGGSSVQVGSQSDAGWTIKKLWAHMHAALIHLPVAWLMLWAGCEGLALLWPHPWLITSGLPLGLMTALGFAPSVYSGLMRLEELAGGQSGYDSAPALLHRNLLLASWTLVVVALALRLFNAPQRSGKLRMLYLLLVFASFALTAYSAHLGGALVYGDDFFPF